MKNLYLNQHLGLGDQILLNGLTRVLCERYDTTFLFVYEHNIPSIKFMYRDLGKKLKIIKVIKSQDPMEHIRFIDSFKIFGNDDHLRIGYSYLHNTKLTADKAFYEQVKIPFEIRFSRFYVERDTKREKDFFDKFDVKENEYIFLHEGGSENKNFINRSRIKSNLKIVQPKIGLTDNIFDYCYLIEHAAEIHVIESSFLFLIDSIKTDGKLFSHRYARPLYDYTVPNLNKNWTIYK